VAVSVKDTLSTYPLFYPHIMRAGVLLSGAIGRVCRCRAVAGLVWLHYVAQLCSVALLGRAWGGLYMWGLLGLAYSEQQTALLFCLGAGLVGVLWGVWCGWGVTRAKCTHTHTHTHTHTRARYSWHAVHGMLSVFYWRRRGSGGFGWLGLKIALFYI